MKKQLITKDSILNNALELSNNILNNSNNLLMIKPANTWINEAKLRPMPKQLFDSFWYENEICILFSDSNVGKSILATQIAQSIASGIPINGFKTEAIPQNVLLLDFELSDKQFQLRYNNNNIPEDNFQFHDNFYRVELNSDADFSNEVNFETAIIKAIEENVKSGEFKTIIVDNITFIKGDNEKAKDAAPFMKQIKDLKKKYNLSILLLAHTPKRDGTKAITQNDLAGSKMIMNFCDSAFTIGMSFVDASLRYIKQIKQRNGSQCYGTDNVCVCKIEKLTNYLQFTFIEYGIEYFHLKEKSKKDKTELVEQVKQLKAEGKNQREIAKQLEIGLGSVNNYLKK